MGLSLRKFAEKFDEDYTLLARIEAGKRFPPKGKVEKYAKILSLSPTQLDALIAIERRGLDPYELLPEIPPAHIPQKFIESEAEKILDKYCRTVNRDALDDGPVPVARVIEIGYGLNTQYLDFTKEKIPNPRRGALYGCLYPHGFRGTDRVVLVNTGEINGRELSNAERRITIAHEAGHYALHCGNTESAQLFFRFTKAPTHCREAEFKPTPFNSHEDQASAFAACLLMPQNQFRKEWLSVSGNLARLAKQFEVTEWLAQLRAKALICE